MTAIEAIAGLGLLAGLGTFLWLWRKSGRDAERAKAARAALAQTEKANDIDEKLRGASDADLKRLYDDSVT